MSILALDPGLTTGWAYHYDSGHFESGQTDFLETCTLVANLAATNHNLVIVSESFLITVNTAKNTQAPWSLELIGVFRYIAQSKLGRELVLQTPANAKKFADDERLKRMGFWLPNNRHANDAARHLLLYMASAKMLTAEQLRGLIT